MSAAVQVAPHPLLEAGVFVSRFPRALGEMAVPAAVAELMALDAPAPVARSEELRQAVRSLLRHGGYKPTGRGKPASEYLVRAAGDGTLASINLAVDACNAVSLASGLPISVVDLDLAQPPLAIAIAPPGTRYVFNPAGQEIDISGLVCLRDGAGSCASAVKDSQRTKTGPGTRTTLSIVWGCRGHEEHVRRAVAWYRELLHGCGVATEPAGLV